MSFRVFVVSILFLVLMFAGIIAVNIHRNHCKQCQGAHPEEVIKP